MEQKSGSLIGHLLKGAAMGIANAIPGVSGGTVAFITGIYERLILALKSFDLRAVKLAGTFQFTELVRHLDLAFLVPLGLGAVIAILAIAKPLLFALEFHETLTLAFFFGLIASSIYFVGHSVSRWRPAQMIAFLLGAAIAASVAFGRPAEENDARWYLLLCGMVAFCSMIVPGLSGSYVLLLMGNYILIFTVIDEIRAAVSAGNFALALEQSLRYLAPLMVGIVIGFVVFSRLISFLFTRARNSTIALLAGFVAGSLLIIWPWKERLPLLDQASGSPVLKGDEPVLAGYSWFFPDLAAPQTYAAIGLMLAGAALVVIVERLGGTKGHPMSEGEDDEHSIQ
jgi:putative membrane protein